MAAVFNNYGFSLRQITAVNIYAGYMHDAVFVPPEQEFAGDITVDEMENLTVGTTSITIDASSEEQVTKRGL